MFSGSSRQPCQVRPKWHPPGTKRGRQANEKKHDDISRRRRKARSKLLFLRAGVYRAFLEMEKAASVDGALSKKSKELIAVGISAVTDSESRMQWHIEQAAWTGASMREITEAVEAAIETGGGRATVRARLPLRRWSLGLHVLRFYDIEVPKNPDGVAQAILDYLLRFRVIPPDPPSGR
jgi:AhpD family alkylhydroperoxidase